MIGRLFTWLTRQNLVIESVPDERRIARDVRSKRQRQLYADKRASECRAARLRFIGEVA